MGSGMGCVGQYDSKIMIIMTNHLVEFPFVRPVTCTTGHLSDRSYVRLPFCEAYRFSHSQFVQLDICR